MQKIDRTRRKRRYLALSFAVPFGVMLLCFILGGLWPFGDRQVLAHDMWHQYYPFFVSFREKLRSGGSLQYLREAGMGIGYLPLYAYYLSSPLYLLSVLVPASLLREFFALLVLTKIGLAGLFFAVFLRTAFRRNEPALVPFSMMYALCSFVAGYYWNIIWLDALALLPLMLAGMVSLLREGRFRLYTLALALSLLCNYYLSFFCCIFVGLSFFVWCICRWDGWKRFFRRFCRIALCTLLGVGMAAVLLLPTLYGLQNTHSAGNEAPELLALNIAEDASGKAAEGQSTLDLLKEQTLPGLAYGARRVLANLLTSTEPTKMEGLPNVYCGFAAVALAVFFLCCKKVRLREKLLSVGLLAFFLLSFLFRTLDYYWHGGHFPNMLPYRFSFLFSFVLIVMAYRAWTLLDCFRKRYLFVILPVCLGIILCGLGLEGSLRRMLLSALALAIVCLALVLYRPERRRQLLSMALLFAVIGAEMVCSIAMGVAKVSLTSRSSYPRESEDVQAVLQAVPEGSGRVEVTSYQTLNDAALNGYRGISIFTSSANVRFNRFSRSLGLASWPASNRYLYYESSPFTNLMCGLEYLIDRDGQQRDTSYTTVAAQSGNVLLLQNRAYLGLGFVADPALGGFVAEQNVYNPIKEQEEMFHMATGLDDALYTHLKYDTLEAPDTCNLRASGTSGTQYSYSTQDGDGQSELSISYVVPQNGLLVATTKSSGNYDLTVYRNGERLFTRNIKVRCLFSLGCFEAGDTVTLTYPVAEGKEGTISLDVAEQNDAVFDAGLSRLSRSVWNVTEDTDTSLSGTVDAAEDGLFYTSIPYENGWRAYVDGVEVPLAQTASALSESVRLTDAVIAFPLTAGQHTVELRYTAPGLKTGAIISGVSLGLFLLLALLLRRRPLFGGEADVPPVTEFALLPDSLPEAPAEAETPENAEDTTPEPDDLDGWRQWLDTHPEPNDQEGDLPHAEL